METKDSVALIAAIGMAIGPFLVIYERLKSDRGMGARAIQFCAVTMVVPLILILALYDKLSSETSATLIGALTGYLLSGVGRFEPQPKKKGDTTSDTDVL